MAVLKQGPPPGAVEAQLLSTASPSFALAPATARQHKMASTEGSNRDSFSSTTSSYSSRSGSRHTPSRLSIQVPDPLPFLPSTYAQRPPSSLSQHRTDGSSPGAAPRRRQTSGSSEGRAGGADEDWEDAEEDADDSQDGQQQSEELPETAGSLNETLYQTASSESTPRRANCSSAWASPAAPLISTSNASPRRCSTSLHQQNPLVSSFPSSGAAVADGGGLGIGLGEAYTRREWGQSGMVGFDGERDTAGTPDDHCLRQSRGHSSAQPEDPEAPRSAAEGLPFPSFTFDPTTLPLARTDDDLAPQPELPELALTNSGSRSSPRSERSLRPSISSSSSSDLSLPAAEVVDSVNLAHSPTPRPAGTFVSVASGPMARLAVDNVTGRSSQPRGPRAFLSNLLNRSPRSNGTSPLLSSAPTSPKSSPRLGGPPRSPSAPSGWQHSPVSAAHRSVAASSAAHVRSSSMPASPTTSASDLRSPQPPTAELADVESSLRRTPRSIAAATFSGLTRSASLRLTQSPPNLPSSPPRQSTSRLPSPRPTSASRMAPDSPAPTIGFSTPPAPAHDASPPPPVQTLGSAGLALVPLTTAMSLSRKAQPLCGALLDDKYLLIGTTGGLDFLPLPLPGSLPMRSHGKKRKETRKPISLIKRTRFKELAVLSERSNILLAIAGRNDHIRVYALDGIRAMIQKKMQELDARDGYPFIQDGALLSTPRPGDTKGKARADPQSSPSRAPRATPPASHSTSAPSNAPIADPYRFPAATPPPDYTFSAPSPRRRPSSFHQASSFVAPGSPIRPTSARSQGSFVTAVPTNPRGSLSGQGGIGPPLGSPRSVRGQKSRDFVASRRGSSTAIMPRRKSKPDISATSPTSGSRRSSLASMAASLTAETPPPLPSPLGQVDRGLGAPGSSSRVSTAAPASPTSGGDAGWMSDAAVSPVFASTSGVGSSSASSTCTTTATQEAARKSEETAEQGKTPESEQTGPTDEGTPRAPTGTMAGLGLGGIQYDERYTLSPVLNKPIPRQAASPRLRQGENSPMLELADLISTSGPGAVPSSDSSSDDDLVHEDVSRLKPRQAASPRLKHEETSPSMELAALMRETGPADSISTSPLPSSDRLSSSASSGSVTATISRSPTLSSLGNSIPRNASRISHHFPARPGSAGSGASRTRERSSVIPQSSSENSLAAHGGPGVSRRVSQRLVARKPTTVASPNVDSMEDDEEHEHLGLPRRCREPQMTLDEVIRDGPPSDFRPSTAPNSTSSLAPSSLPKSASASSIQSIASAGGSPTNRSSKRWTMSGMGSKLLSRPGGPNEGGSSGIHARHSLDTSSSSTRPSPDRPARRREESAPSSSTPSTALDTRPSPPAAPVPPIDFKRKPSHATVTERPQLAESSQLPDSHPANSSSPLEYVKLARTKGARMLRAVETKKRTYLAVLCGDEGERIELFTGSRSISLSLNRTFVLPENPRTIEFQLQGDDLVDIYLVYAESIFALEPATVRVREVGVGRGERRARRERERRMRDGASSSPMPSGGISPEPDASTSTLHPADPARQEAVSDVQSATVSDDTVDISSITLGLAGASTSRSPSPAQSASATEDDGVVAPPVPARTPTSHRPSPPVASTSSSSDPAAEAAPPIPPQSKPTLPYSTFQQLPFVPPVPSSVLSSAWVIPPLYTDVVGGDSPDLSPPGPEFGDSSYRPSIRITGDGDTGDSSSRSRASREHTGNLPLLSPISLLGGAAHRANGPPGLFFVSKGKNLSGIVTAEGKSIIKRPLVWSLDKASAEEGTSDVTQRLEMLVVGGTKTVVVGIGSADVKAIAVGGEAGQAPFGAAIPVTAAPTGISDLLVTREVQWLGTHAASSQLFFSERVGQQVTVHCLFAKF